MKRVAVSAAALTFMLSSSVALATVVVLVSVDEMSREAKAVVRAKVVSQQAAWDEAHKRIHTYTELQVLERVHTAETIPDVVVVRTLGGIVGDVGMKVSGTSQFKAGEEVMVFLNADRLDSKNFVVIGMSQGKYSIDRSSGTAMAIPGVHGLAFANRTTGKIDAERGVKPGQLSLQALVAQVRVAVGQDNTSPKLVAPGQIVPGSKQQSPVAPVVQP